MFFNTQVDDMFLETDIYQPAGTTFRIRTSDLDAILTWQADINTRLTSGSSYVIEIGYNGNGDIDNATNTDATASQAAKICDPDTAVYYADEPDPPLDYVKPVGTGVDQWPTTPKNYTWSLACAELDPLENWFQNTANSAQLRHISHTFTHLNLDNATYNDTYKEIQFNQVYLAEIGLANGTNFSPHGIIPPAITGIHNGDALRAWKQLGIDAVVGDSSRPLICNQQNEFWPYITSVAADGFDGMVVVPRWRTFP